MNPATTDSAASFVYWEKQGSDRLCGVHCLNSLLQGPFFDEVNQPLIVAAKQIICFRYN